MIHLRILRADAIDNFVMTAIVGRDTGGGPVQERRWGRRASTPRTRRRVATRAALAVIVGVVVTAPVTAPATAGASAAQQSELDVQIEVGVAGKVTDRARMPVRVSITSERSRTVELELDNSSGTQHFEVELNAGAATVVDTVFQVPVGRVEAVVRADGRRIGNDTVRTPTDLDAMLVGVGPSIASGREPWTSPTIGSIQEATLLPLTDEVFDRPGVLDALNSVVLGPTDIDRLDDTRTRRLSAWVARGGNLALDMAPVSPLPVLGIPAEPGARTAVEAGWVRFTDGAGGRGDWASTIEPATVADAQQPVEAFADDMGFSAFDDQLRFTGLLDIEYLPSSVIVLAVFLTSLVVGPLLWFVLRGRSRRRWMWTLAPGLSVAIAAALTVAGQGALSDATTFAIGGGVSTAWGSSGDFGVGTSTDDADIDLGDEGTIWASGPRITSSRNDDGVVTQDLGTNSFGYVGAGVVPVSDGALVSVSAVPGDEGSVAVTVTNHSALRLTDVSVSGFTRVRDFDDVAAGESATLEFDTERERSAFGTAYPSSDDMGMGCWGNSCFSGEYTPFGRIGSPALSSMGRIEVRGLLDGRLDVVGHERSAVMQVVARTTVVPGPDGSAPAGSTIRIESVGATRELALAGDGDGFDDFGGPFVPGGPVPVPAPGAVPVPTTSGGGFGDDTISFADPVGGGGSDDGGETTIVYAAMSSPVDRAAVTCQTHTIVSSIEQWVGGAWVPVTTSGPPVDNVAFNEPRETQPYAIGVLRAGEVRFLRMTVGVGLHASSTMLCEEQP